MIFDKLFNKNKYVKAVIYGADKRIRVYFVKPSGTNITIKGKTFIINEDDFYLDAKGFPTYTYRHDSTEPLNPVDGKKSLLSPEYYNVAMESKVARDILESSKGIEGNMVYMFLGLVAVGVIGFAFYSLFNQIQSMQKTINDMYQIIKLMGGV